MICLQNYFLINKKLTIYCVTKILCDEQPDTTAVQENTTMTTPLNEFCLNKDTEFGFLTDDMLLEVLMNCFTFVLQNIAFH